MLIAKMISKSTLAFFMIGLLAGGVNAQGPGGRGGPGGGGPGGGRGMMGGMGMGGGSLGLLMMKEVREELNLDEDQTKELEDMGKAMFENMASMMRPPQGQAPDPNARQEAMEKLRKASEEAEGKLSDILDPKQMERLVGLLIQRENLRSVNSKLVADKLGITSEQKERFAAIQKENIEKMSEMFQQGGGGFGGPESREKMRTLREEAEAKMKEVLTSAQKDQMETLKGPEFKFPEPQWGRGGAGGRGGPGGGRGGAGGGG